MDVLRIESLRKRFGNKEVLCGLDLSVPEHSIFGFIGRNGAGKTTTMKAVLGLLRPDGGNIFVMGEQVRFGCSYTNRSIGFLPDVPEFYPYMTPLEYLRLCGEVCGMEKSALEARSRECLAFVGLEGENRRIKGFSRGMKQRLGIAQALLNRPKLLICDEPTSALDPAGRKEILELLCSVREQTTVVFSTHILSDVERICTDVAILSEGKNVMQGSILELRSMCQPNGFLIETRKTEDADSLLLAFSGLHKTEQNILAFEGSEAEFFSVMRYMAENKIPVQKVERLEPTLESLFLEVTK